MVNVELQRLEDPVTDDLPREEDVRTVSISIKVCTVLNFLRLISSADQIASLCHSRMQITLTIRSNFRLFIVRLTRSLPSVLLPVITS